MTINLTDWVWFTYMGHTKFGEFSYLHPDLQYSLSRIFKRTSKTYNMFNPNEELWLHMVLPAEGRKYTEKIHFLFKGANTPKFNISRLPGGDHWLHGESPVFGPIGALNDDRDYEGKKRLYLDYIDWLCKFIVVPEPRTFKEIKRKAYWKSHEEEILKLLTRLRNKSKMLEERPVKANKKFLVELTKYDKEKKQPLSDKEAVVIEYKDSTPVNAKNVIDLVKSIYVNVEDEWDKTQDILTIEDGSYIIGSGHVDYSEERLNAFKSGTLLELNMVHPNHYKFHYKEIGEKGKSSTGVEYIRLPRYIDVNKVLSFYQNKFPNKNYNLDKTSTKKELSERSQKLKDLPHKGETQTKDLRKVCYKKKDGDMIWRGPFNEVKQLVDSGDYTFAPKAAWKSQITKIEIEGGAEILIKKGEANKSNIHQPLDKGKKLGARKEKREERKAKAQLKSLRKFQQMHQRSGQRKPGDVERKLQSEKDKKAYIEKCKKMDKKVISQRVYRAFEAVILGDKAEVLATLSIKAKSNDQAEKILKIIMKNKSKNGKLTGNIREWIKQTGKNRQKKGL